MFSIGDKIVYGSTGVCTILGIGVPDIPGDTRECYVLKPSYMANTTVYAPVEKTPVSMRLVLSPDEMQSLIDSLPDIKPFPESKEKTEMHDICRNAVKSADGFMLAKLIKTLHEKKLRIMEQKKAVSSVEKEYFDTAEKIFHGEIATVLGMPMEKVGTYIQARIFPNSVLGQSAAS